jgi:hypothetical protein
LPINQPLHLASGDVSVDDRARAYLRVQRLRRPT